MNSLSSLASSQKTTARPMILIGSGIDHDPLPESWHTDTHVYQPGEKITKLTSRNIRDALDMGFSILQVAAGSHFNFDVRADGYVAGTKLQEDLQSLAECGAEVLLLAGFYWIPPSLHADPRPVAMRCLAHDQTIPIFSIWDEFTYEWIGKCVAALAEQVRSSPARLRAIGAMICGDFGEAIFPAGMLNAAAADSRSEPGLHLHNHSDFWCNDRSARRAYMAFLRQRYPNSASLSIPDPADPKLFPACPERGQPLRPWLDFLEWYHDSMTRYATRVVGMFRSAFPDQEIVIWLGGGVEPHSHGQDNTALPKAMAPLRATIRSTASASQLIPRELHPEAVSVALGFQRNYPIIKRIATACRFYDTPLWLEPPYPPGLSGPSLAGRVFEAISCGACGYFEWTRTLQRQRARYPRFQEFLIQERSIVEVALYFPLVSHRAVAESQLPEPFWNAATHVRAVTDYDIVDDRLIQDGALDGYAVLVLPQLDRIERGILERIQRWVDSGGILIAQDGGPIGHIDSDGPDWRQWLGLAPAAQTLNGRGVNINHRDDHFWQSTQKHFMDRPIRAFSSIESHATALLEAAEGVAALLCNHGKGMTVLCTADPASALLINLLRDMLRMSPRMGHLASRQALMWTDERRDLFATVFNDRILLANLTPHPMNIEESTGVVTLHEYDLHFVGRTDSTRHG